MLQRHSTAVPAEPPARSGPSLVVSPALAPKSRVESIDLLRGAVMILMALDHVRDWFHVDSFLLNPTDADRTTPALFATRWITHLCAPAFVLLAGTSAAFASRRRTPGETSRFLVTRGLWLVVLQLTVIRFAWNFDPAFHYNSSNVVSTIGVSMIALAALVRVPPAALLVFGAVTVAGHNLLDGVSVARGSAPDVLWAFLHVHTSYDLGHGYSFTFLYPLVPWIGVMSLGYGLGRLYEPGVRSETRALRLLAIGTAGVAAFVALRAANVYGDPLPWTRRGTRAGTVMSFLDVEKYPPSLLYLCATLGVALVLLAAMEGRSLERFRPVIVFGRVALFYYVLHIFVIHLGAVAAVVACGHPWRTMVFTGRGVAIPPALAGSYGFGLGTTYLIWAGFVLLLYPFCRRWNALKTAHRDAWWVSYV
jgi:uncharacterized membrane protein